MSFLLITGLHSLGVFVWEEENEQTMIMRLGLLLSLNPGSSSVTLDNHTSCVPEHRIFRLQWWCDGIPVQASHILSCFWQKVCCGHFFSSILRETLTSEWTQLILSLLTEWQNSLNALSVIHLRLRGKTECLGMNCNSILQPRLLRSCCWFCNSLL